MPLLKKNLKHQNPDKTSQNPIVRGKFPVHYQSRNYSSYRLNKVLCCLMIIGFLMSMTTYSMVCSKESNISDLHKQINEINNENTDLQNKVDYLQSFYNINKKVSNVDFLKRADKVIEINAHNTLQSKNDLHKMKVHTISGY